MGLNSFQNNEYNSSNQIGNFTRNINNNQRFTNEENNSNNSLRGNNLSNLSYLFNHF